MNKTIRKHQKKILAVFGIFLMISFAATTGSYSQRGRADTDLGTLNKGKVTLKSSEQHAYAGQWQLLRRNFSLPALCTVFGGVGTIDPNLVVRAMTDSQTMDRVRQLITFRQQNPELYSFYARQSNPDEVALAECERVGEEVFGQLEANDELFAILAKEAQALGVGVDNDMVMTIIAARGITHDADPDFYDATHDALRTFLMINNAADLSSRVVKLSQPERANLVATQQQRIGLNLVEFSAKDYLDKAPAPTAEQMQKQFDKYKDVESTASPDGFGYKYPNRVKYEAIEIKKDDLKKAIAAPELDQMYEYFYRHPGEFVSDKPATTRDAFNIEPGPTTRPMKFEEAREKVATTLTNQRVDELATKVRDAVRGTMRTDYEAYKAAVAAKASPVPNSSLGVPYDSKEYLSKLRDKVQAEHKVTLTIEREEGLQTPTTLAESKLGKDTFTSRTTGLTFSQFMTMALDPFLNDDQRRALSGRPDGKPPAVWEPTPSFTNATGDELIARATVADPAHVPASMDEVKDKVAADVKQSAAYELAKHAAEAAAESARTGGKWLQTIAAEQNKKVFNTGLFDLRSVQSGMPITGYELKQQSTGPFVREAMKLLAAAPRTGEAVRPASTQATTQAATTQPTTKAATQASAATTRATTGPVAQFKDHPIGVIELKAEGKVLVAEVDQLRPSWTKDSAAARFAGMASMRESEYGQMMRVLWFNYDNVVKRVGFTPTEGRERKQQNRRGPAAPVAPFNPFTGTALP